MNQQPNSSSNTAEISLLPVLSVNFVGALGFSIVVPFLVFLVTKWGGNAIVYGLIGATYSAFQLIGAPILGRWSDRYGRRKILLLSQLGTLVSWLIFLIAFFVPVRIVGDIDSTTLGQFTLTLPLVLLFLARAADGITGGNVSVANAYLADITDEDDRTRNFGKMALTGNLGFVLGPALAGLLGATIYGAILPVFAALLISILATLIIVFGLKESDPCILTRAPSPRNMRKVFGQDHKECYSIRDPEKVGFRTILKIPHVPRLLGVYFLVMLGFSFFYIGFPVHAVNELRWTITDTGMFFAYLSLVMVFVQGPVLAKASNILSEGALAFGGALILTIGFICLFWEGLPVIYLAATLIGLGNGLMWPSVMAMLSNAAGDVHQGAVQGASGSIGAIASIVGLIAGGLLYDWLGAWVFVIAALVVLPVSIVSPHTRHLH
jgi:DHA1 family tetracycline resistance protein-like MFS transporter